MKYCKLFLLILCICVVCQSALVNAEDMPIIRPMPDCLKSNYFERIAVTATNLTIKNRSSGGKYFYRKNDGSLKRCEAGEEIAVAVGESLTIIDRYSSMTFAPLPDTIKRHGFEVTEEADLRSFGKELKTNIVFMITSEIKGAKDIKDTNVFFLEPKINAVEEFLKGHALDK